MGMEILSRPGRRLQKLGGVEGSCRRLHGPLVDHDEISERAADINTNAIGHKRASCDDCSISDQPRSDSG